MSVITIYILIIHLVLRGATVEMILGVLYIYYEQYLFFIYVGVYYFDLDVKLLIRSNVIHFRQHRTFLGFN